MSPRTPIEYAPPVEVPRRIAFVGTQLLVVAAESEQHARAIVRFMDGGLVDRKVKHTAREIRVRRLRVDDQSLIESWERAHAAIRTGTQPLHQGTRTRESAL